MKAWFGAIGRAALDFLILLVLASGAAVLSSAPPGLGLSVLPLAALREALRFFPLAAAAAIGLGFLPFERLVPSRVVTTLSLVLFGFGLLAGGLALRRQDFPEAAKAARGAPPAGVAVESGANLLYVGSYEGGSGRLVARGAVAYEAASPVYPRLAFEERAAYDTEDRSVIVEGAAYPAFPHDAAPGPLLPSLPALSGKGLDSRLKELDGLGFPLALAAAGGFALLVAGLSGAARFARWPLAGLFVAGAGIALALLADALLFLPSVAGLLGDLAGAMGLGSLDPPILAALLEGSLGLVACLVCLFAPRGRRA